MNKYKVSDLKTSLFTLFSDIQGFALIMMDTLEDKHPNLINLLEKRGEEGFGFYMSIVAVVLEIRFMSQYLNEKESVALFSEAVEKLTSIYPEDDITSYTDDFVKLINKGHESDISIYITIGFWFLSNMKGEKLIQSEIAETKFVGQIIINIINNMLLWPEDLQELNTN